MVKETSHRQKGAIDEGNRLVGSETRGGGRRWEIAGGEVARWVGLGCEWIRPLSLQIPLTDAIKLPPHSHYMKDIVSNKRKIPNE